MVSNEIFLMSVFKKMGYTELGNWLWGTATLQEKHPLHASKPEWVIGAENFREQAQALSKAVKAAENKDTEKGRELGELHREILLGIDVNACYFVMRALHAKDDSLQYAAGYERREKVRRSTAVLSISQLPLKVTAKRGKAGEVILTIERDPAAALYEVQFCKGEPNGEASWQDGDKHKRCRVVVGGLELANWYFFRVRGHGDHETGPWSIPIAIIVA